MLEVGSDTRVVFVYNRRTIDVQSMYNVKIVINPSVSAITGAFEPVYGAKAFRSVDDSVKDKNPYGGFVRDDLLWRNPHSSNVETMTFYFYSEETGYYGFFQVIHSNPVGLHVTAQFTCLIVNKKDGSKTWTSTHLDDQRINGTDLHAEGFDLVLNEAGDEYSFTSIVNDDCMIEVKVKRVTDGFKIGTNGTSYYGEDAANPWGSMRHIFWPRCVTNGKLLLKGKNIHLKDEKSMYVMALQGMKPHHAAARWNFCNFQGPTTSVVVMEFTTPESYGSSKSSIGCVVKDGKLLSTAVHCSTKHLTTIEDKEVGWPRPASIEFDLQGPTVDAKDTELEKHQVKTVVSGNLPELLDRVDVLHEIPQFVKKVVSGVSGTKPYIYQYCNPLKARIEMDGEVFEEEGVAFVEATFIS